ncbi:MAG: rRNA maturation RNase YbeY [Candidatus Omnitrophica bacterium]|nr:rRNA maturation RNase YbeY [Candidatus Omnitrophota bacterium]
MSRASFQIIDNQRAGALAPARLRTMIKKICASADIDPEAVSFVFCGNERIRELNRRYLRTDSVTDVIAFPLAEKTEPGYLGEVVVSVERAVEAAPSYRHGWEKELALYCIHGVLHLLGYDDRTAESRREMERRQEEILQDIYSER